MPVNKDPSTGEKLANILIIDDESFLASSLACVLSSAGYASIICSTAKEAIKLFSKQWMTIDLILLDFTMPDMPGQDILHALRCIDPKASIMLCSGYDLKKEYPGIENTVNDVILKPVSSRELVSRIEKTL